VRAQELGAPFSPIPFTPGMLSDESPTSERRSSICDGGAVARSTSAGPSRRSRMVSTTTTSDTSCRRSVRRHDLHLVARAFAAARARRSRRRPSPACSTVAKRYAATIFRIHGICARRSSGVASRVALYSAYSSLRRLVRLGASHTTTTASGPLSRRSFCSMVVKPSVAWVGTPALFASAGSAKNAR
jgi:hypothetical protein